MHTLNKELAKIFSEMASIYQLVDGQNRFRVRAYQNASRVLDNMSEDVGLNTQSWKKIEQFVKSKRKNRG